MWKPSILLFFCLALPIQREAAGNELSSATRRVEQIRGLSFIRPVVQKQISRSELSEYLNEQITKGTGIAPRRYVELLKALHLLDSSPRPLERLRELYEGQVLAFYDPDRHTYFSLNEPPEGIQLNAMIGESVVIHELTHALQDQRFDAGVRLDRIKKDWDGALAYLAFLEGEATAVMIATTAGPTGIPFDVLIKSDEVIEAIAAVAASNPGISADASPYFVSSMKFPYLEGLRFVIEAYRRGGWSLITEIHTHPPVNSAQILHPELYFAASKISPPPASGLVETRRLWSVTLGEFHWRFLLGAGPAAGWIADRVEVQRGRGSRRAVAVESLWSSEKDAVEFRDAYAGFLEKHGEKVWSQVEGRNVRLAYAPDLKTLSSLVAKRRWAGKRSTATAAGSRQLPPLVPASISSRP